MEMEIDGDSCVVTPPVPHAVDKYSRWNTLSTALTYLLLLSASISTSVCIGELLSLPCPSLNPTSCSSR